LNIGPVPVSVAVPVASKMTGFDTTTSWTVYVPAQTWTVAPDVAAVTAACTPEYAAVEHDVSALADVPIGET
ncbi:MAG: hypothetical protein M0Z95_26205, partial [Actinomycetota bacterium]|nr:hypothetical protein [Actinomycetota bacterium]